MHLFHSSVLTTCFLLLFVAKTSTSPTQNNPNNKRHRTSRSTSEEVDFGDDVGVTTTVLPLVITDDSVVVSSLTSREPRFGNLSRAHSNDVSLPTSDEISVGLSTSPHDLSIFNESSAPKVPASDLINNHDNDHSNTKLHHELLETLPTNRDNRTVFAQPIISGCLSNPCAHNGTCHDLTPDSKSNLTYTCDCKKGFSGSQCTEIESYNPCSSNPCQNRGTCVSTNGSSLFVCDCINGYSGINCEKEIDDCIGVKCSEGKICIDLIGTYKCECPLGFTGENCSVKIDHCAKTKCVNGATCISSPINATCSCRPGFTGDSCELDIDECIENEHICNNGICRNTFGSYLCYCTPGWNGFHCDIEIDECLSNPCRNGAKCNNLQATFSCDCPPGFSGNQCEIDVDDCSPNPCLHNGECFDGLANFTCKCPIGFEGHRCENNIDDCSSHPCLNNGELFCDVYGLVFHILTL